MLRTIISKDGYIFDETNFKSYKDGARAWERLTYLWKSWFSLENLEGLSAIINAKRVGTKIIIKARQKFNTPTTNNRLNSIYNVSRALADDVTCGLSGLLLLEKGEVLEPTKWDFPFKELEKDKIDIKLEILASRWRLFDIGSGKTNESYESLIAETQKALLEDYGTPLSRLLSASRITLIKESIRVTKDLKGDLSAEIVALMFSEDVDTFWGLPEIRLGFNVSGMNIFLKTPNIFKRLINFMERNSKLDDLIQDYTFFLRKSTLTREQQQSSKLTSEQRQSMIVEVLRIARKQNNHKLLEIIYLEYLEKSEDYIYPANKFSTILTLETIRIARELGDLEHLTRLYTNLESAIYPSLLNFLKVYNNLISGNERFSINGESKQKYLPIEVVIELFGLIGIFSDHEQYNRLQHIILSISENLFSFPNQFVKAVITLAKEMGDTSTQWNIYKSFHKFYVSKDSENKYFDIDLLITISEIYLEIQEKGNHFRSSTAEFNNVIDLLIRSVNNDRLQDYSLEQIYRIESIADKTGKREFFQRIIAIIRSLSS